MSPGWIINLQLEHFQAVINMRYLKPSSDLLLFDRYTHVYVTLILTLMLIRKVIKQVLKI